MTSVVCLATPSSRLASPLARHTAELLTELLRALPRADAVAR